MSLLPPQHNPTPEEVEVVMLLSAIVGVIVGVVATLAIVAL